MKKELSIIELVENLKDLYIKSYEALFINNDYKTSNKYVKQYVKIEEQLVSSPDGIQTMSILLDDKNEIVRYYASSALISLYPKKCIKILKEIEKGNSFLSIQVKYVLANYDQNNNYIQKFLETKNTTVK